MRSNVHRCCLDSRCILTGDTNRANLCHLRCTFRGRLLFLSSEIRTKSAQNFCADSFARLYAQFMFVLNLCPRCKLMMYTSRKLYFPMYMSRVAVLYTACILFKFIAQSAPIASWRTDNLARSAREYTFAHINHYSRLHTVVFSYCMGTISSLVSKARSDGIA